MARRPDRDTVQDPCGYDVGVILSLSPRCARPRRMTRISACASRGRHRADPASRSLRGFPSLLLRLQPPVHGQPPAFHSGRPDRNQRLRKRLKAERIYHRVRHAAPRDAPNLPMRSEPEHWRRRGEMAITIALPSALQPYAGGSMEVMLEDRCETVGDAL